MGCSAAVNALKLAHHIVRSEPRARVLVVNLELCTLHLQDSADLEVILGALLFGDGSAASLVTAEPNGIVLENFRAVTIPDSHEPDHLVHRRFRFRDDPVGRGPVAHCQGPAPGTPPQ